MGPIYTFVKQVKTASVTAKEILDPSTISKIITVLGKLEIQPKATVSAVEDIGLRTNPKKWVSSLLAGYPNDFNAQDVEYLLLDFTEPMQTRMREETKYALALLMENGLFVCHTIYGEETITPEWEIIPRMMDIDNVLRYVSFFIKEGIIYVRYWERHATSSFIGWLGLPRKQAFLFGGTYRILSRIEDVTVELQLTEDEIDGWIKAHPEIKKGKIDLASPVQYLTVEEIRAGRKHYDHAEDFIQDFEAEKRGVPRYQHEYKKLKSEALPLLVEYYDEETQVVSVVGDEENIEIEKITPGFDILFADGVIRFRASYLSELARRLLNRQEVNVFHAGHDFRIEPYVLGRLRVFNKLKVNKVSQLITDYYNDTNLQDNLLDSIVRYAALQVLGGANANSPMDYVVSNLGKALLDEVGLVGSLSKLEDTVIEYKSRDVLSGGNDQVISTLAEDVQNVWKSSTLAILIVGVQDDGTIDAVPSSRVTSDRLETIRKGLARELHVEKVYVSSIRSENGALILVVANAE
jgi:predicted transcriptional regulator